jgi:hypothetical protein
MNLGILNRPRFPPGAGASLSAARRRRARLPGVRPPHQGTDRGRCREHRSRDPAGTGKKQTPWLTSMAVDLTALGSITLVVLFAAFTLVVLLASHDRMGALQLLGPRRELAF